MSAWSLAGGVLGLVVLETIVQPEAAGRLKGALGLVQTGVQRLLSPTVAGIPDRSAAAAATSTQPAGSVTATSQALIAAATQAAAKQAAQGHGGGATPTKK